MLYFKIILLSSVILANQIASGQDPNGIYQGQNIGSSIDHMIGMYGYGTGTPASAEMFGRSAEINSMGNYILKESIANVNNQVAYEHALKNDRLRAELYFGKRQTNGFHRTLEDWQKEEKIRRKRDNGHLTRQDIYEIYRR